MFPRCEELPAHVAPSLAYDHDVFSVDAYDGDFAAAMFRLWARGAPDLFWTRYNRGHWVATSPSLIETVLIQPGALLQPRHAGAERIQPLTADPAPDARSAHAY